MKLKTSMVKNKRQYICPVISCLSVNYHICAQSLDGGHQNVNFDQEIKELDVTESTNQNP